MAGGADALGIAGGDGSLAVVARPPLAHGLPFVCVPAGTRNHFALDLGVDRDDLIGSLDAFTDGVERRIDVAEVNGRLFLNNVSLGIYGDAVRQPAYRDAKARTLLETAAEVLGPSAAGSRPAARRRPRARTPHPAVVLVSNNPYALDPAGRPAPGRRSTAAASGSSSSTRRARPQPGRAWTATRLEVTAPAPVHAGVDGEAIDLTPPLRFVIRPDAAAEVMVPSSWAVSLSAREAPVNAEARRRHAGLGSYGR